MGMREQEDGKSECRSVTDRIRVQTLPDCESRQTSIWCPFAREFEESFYEGKQMTASILMTNAPSGNYENRKSIPWKTVQKDVRRLQVRIAKAVIGCLRITAGSSRKGTAFGMLEPYDGKLSRRVLRGFLAGNSSRLPDCRSAFSF
jgi:hypothetical protein